MSNVALEANARRTVVLPRGIAMASPEDYRTHSTADQLEDGGRATAYRTTGPGAPEAAGETVARAEAGHGPGATERCLAGQLRRMPHAITHPPASPARNPALSRTTQSPRLPLTRESNHGARHADGQNAGIGPGGPNANLERNHPLDQLIIAHSPKLTHWQRQET